MSNKTREEQARQEVERLMREPGTRRFSDQEVAEATQRAAELSRKAGEYMLSRVKPESRTRYR